uniref:RNA-binding protein Nova-1 n=1 Tax=Rhizophora mucronata TaxID=61149 RepID=A0A2P2IQ28_RHIMU
MREQQPATEEQQEQEQKELNDGGKRKLEDTIEIAKQKVLELASRFVNDADSKRPRLGSDNASDPSSDPSPFPGTLELLSSS